MPTLARVEIETKVPMLAPDGTTLRADVYRPVGTGPVPALIHRTPYGRHQAHYIEMAREIAAHGYLVILQDLRGRFDSEGTFLPMWVEGRRDGEDGARAVEWAQTLPGVLPRVGMYGVSYDASVQWETAGLTPTAPGLRSIFPGGMVADSRSIWPGIFRIGRQLKWYFMLAADTRRRAGLPRPHDRADSEKLWHLEGGKYMWNVPLSAVPEDRLGGLAPYFGEWLDKHVTDWYDFIDIPTRIPDVAIGLVTGWHDRCLDTVELFTAAQGSRRATATELIVGPWSHGYAQPRIVGEVDFGPDAESTFVGRAVDWFGRTLAETPAPPTRNVELFIMGANEWRSYDRWPIETTTSVLHLAPGALDEQRPAESTSIPYVYDPVDPVPSTYSADYQDAPIDQGVNDGRHDVVRFLTPPLERPVEIIGSASVVLYGATDAPDTDWHVKLIDVAPNGTAINVATGMIRARYRDGFESPRPLERDEIVEYTIRLRATANRFLAGHRIRLDVTSSDFPNFDRNHNEGGDDNRSSTFRVAHQRLFVGGEHPSRLELPHPIGD